MKRPGVGSIILSIFGFIIGIWIFFIELFSFNTSILLSLSFILLSVGLLLHWRWIGLIFWIITVLMGLTLVSCSLATGEAALAGLAIPMIAVPLLWSLAAGVYTNRW